MISYSFLFILVGTIFVILSICILSNKKNIEIKEITQNKEKYMDLLLLGDEQENMVKKYLYRGKLFALHDGDLKTVSVVTKEDESIYEIKPESV